jgi:hypothetical protein
MQPYHPPCRKTWSSLLTALIATSAIFVPVLTHSTPADASQGGHAAITSVVGAASPAGPSSTDGFKCIHVVVCGYEFSTAATKTIVLAAAAGGIGAAVVACNSIPGVSQTICAVIGGASGAVIGKIVSDWKINKCLFVHTGAPLGAGVDLIDC